MKDSQKVENLISYEIEKTVSAIFEELKLGIISAPTECLKSLLEEVDSLSLADKTRLFNFKIDATTKIDTIFNSKSITILSNYYLKKGSDSSRDDTIFPKPYESGIERIGFLCTDFINKYVDKKRIKERFKGKK